MMLSVWLLGLLIDPQAAGLPPRAADLADLRVVVAAPVYQPDGSVSVETATLSNAAPNVVHLYGRRSLCDTVTAGATEPTDASFGWRLTSHVVSATASELIVSIDWQRLWDRGQRLTNGPSGTVQLKLHPGDRIPLDHIPNPLATDACRAVGLGLEVKLARTMVPAPPDSALLPLGAVEGGAAMLDADLWLVHTLPADTQRVQHQKVRLSLLGASFGFAPLTVTTPLGDVMVEVTGSFRRYRSPTGGEFLYVTLARSFNGGPTPPGGVTGGTGTMIVLRDPTEVLSLEIPAAGRFQGEGGAGGGRGRGGGGGGGPRGGFSVPGGTVGAGGGAAGAVQRGGARGGGGRTSAPVPEGALAGSLQAMRVLDGHAFSLRLRLTPVPAQ